MNSNKSTNLLLRGAALLLVAASLVASAPLRAAEVAGRVLIAIGDVKIVRGAQALPAQRGTEILSGDTVELGKQSNAQVLFTDNGIVALRPDTTFKVSEYSYKDQRQGAIQRAFFSLVKGGIRTVTGVIGHLHHENYKVDTPSATIGIRGTNYTLVQCDGNCRNADGSRAPAGTYGAVTDGRIAVTNRSGEHQFGANQYFQVSSITAAPRQLIAPPAFLRDELEGRARSREKHEEQAKTEAKTSEGGGSESATTTAQTGQGAGTGDSRITASSTSTATPTVVTTIPFQVTNQVATAGPTTLVQPTTSSPILFFRTTGGTVPVSNCTGTCGNATIGEVALGVSLVLQRAYVRVAFTDDQGGVFNVGTPGNSDGIPVTVSGSTITFSGTINRADYPTQNGAFRCSECGTNGVAGLGYLDTTSVSGTISGGTATLTFAGSNSTTGGGQFTVSLPSATPPNQLAAAAIIPNSPGSGTGSGITTSSYWDVQVDATGALTRIGPPMGWRQASLGSATNKVVGSDGGPGNLQWGYWYGTGANVVDSNYVSYTSSGNGFSIPWIVGQATQTLPASLGTVTYSPIGSVVNGNVNGMLNSASLTADFVNRKMSVDITATNTVNSNVFTMNGSSGFSATSGRFAGGFSSVSCTGGPCGSSPGGSFGGFFAGPNAEGAGVAFSAGYGVGGGVSGAVAFKR